MVFSIIKKKMLYDAVFKFLKDSPRTTRTFTATNGSKVKVTPQPWRTNHMLEYHLQCGKATDHYFLESASALGSSAEFLVQKIETLSDPKNHNVNTNK